MRPFFHEVVSDLDALQVGIYVHGGDSVVETLPDGEHSIVYSGVRALNASILCDGWLSFYDDTNSRYGALNCMEASLWSIHDEPSYCGRGRRPESVAVQVGFELRHHALADGAVLDRQTVSSEIVALSDTWELTKHGQKLSVSIAGEPLFTFAARGTIYEVAESEGYLVLIERQGLIRVIDLAMAAAVFERQAPEGSEYRRAAVTKAGMLTYTQHYFNRPKTTIVHQRALSAGEDLNTREIPLSGCYHLRKRGMEILFASCQVYCSTTATLLRGTRTTNA